MAGGALGWRRVLNPAIRRSTQFYSLVESHLVVLIPHISTDEEVHRKKYRRMYMAALWPRWSLSIDSLLRITAN